MSTGSTGRSPISSIAKCKDIECGMCTMRGAGKNIDCCGVAPHRQTATFHININLFGQAESIK